MFKDAIGQEVADELNKRIRELEAALAAEKAENLRLIIALSEIAEYFARSTTYQEDAEHLQGIASRALEAK